jgi:hypothetical protein
MVGSNEAGVTAGDVVVQLVQRVAHGELGRDLGDREAGGLGRQRGGARHARVHLDDHHAAVFGVHGELHVGAAGLHADLAQHRDRGVAHHLVFLVGQRQRGGDGDRVAGMHAHRVDVLDGADDDAVVRLVADDLHLVFLPAEQDSSTRICATGEASMPRHGRCLEFLAVVGDAAAGAAEREGGADDGGQADLVERVHGLRLPRSMSYLPVVIELRRAVTMVARGFSSPIRSIASRNSLRSSAISMASRLAPIISTPYFSSTPISSSASAVLSPVCPPMVGSSASGRSFSMILATTLRA